MGATPLNQICRQYQERILQPFSTALPCTLNFNVAWNNACRQWLACHAIFFFGVRPVALELVLRAPKTKQHWNPGCKGQVSVKGCNIFSCTSTPPKVKQQWDSGCRGQARVSEKSAMHMIRQLFIARSGLKFCRLYDNGCSFFMQVMYRYLREVKMTMLSNIFCFCWSCPAITE